MRRILAQLHAGLDEAAAVPFGSDGYKPANSDFIDGMTYDPKTPGAYIDSLKIGLKTGESNAAITAG